jgi:iron(III) transport system substrate-binding protein
MNKWLIVALISALALVAPLSAAENTVTVYTHRHYEVDQQLFDQFTKQTGDQGAGVEG